jgi:hypothetical protein
VGSSGTAYSGAFATLLGADLHFAAAIEPIGSFMIQAEYAHTSVNASDYGDYHFTNERQGAYALLSYSPGLVPVPFIRDLEIVGRYDWIQAPSGSPQHSMQGYTIGLDYWIQSTVVLKVAYSAILPEGFADPVRQVLTQLAAGL